MKSVRVPRKIKKEASKYLSSNIVIKMYKNKRYCFYLLSNNAMYIFISLSIGTQNLERINKFYKPF